MKLILVLLLLGCRAPSSVDEPSESVQDRAALKTHMQEHLSMSESARRAFMKGELEALATPAQAFIDHRVSNALPGRWVHYVTDIGASAVVLKTTTDVAQAGQALTTLANACGRCHESLGVSVKVPVRTTSVADNLAHNARFNVSMDLMWTSLLTHSGLRWEQGWLAFSQAESLERRDPIRAAHQWTDPKGYAVQDSWEQRSVILGQIMSECAQCHRETQQKEAGHGKEEG